MEIINGTYLWIMISFLSFSLPLKCLCVCAINKYLIHQTYIMPVLTSCDRSAIYADCQIYMLEIPEVNTPFMLIVAGRYVSVPLEKALERVSIILCIWLWLIQKAFFLVWKFLWTSRCASWTKKITGSRGIDTLNVIVSFWFVCLCFFFEDVMP